MIFDETRIRLMAWGNIRYKVEAPYYIEIYNSSFRIDILKSFLNFDLMERLCPETKYQRRSQIKLLKDYVEDPLFEIEFEKYKLTEKI